MGSEGYRRPTIALYHHLPPGGADRAMYELTRRTADEFRYVLYEIELTGRDPFIGADRNTIRDVVDEVHTVTARSGGESRLSRWAMTVPSVMRAEATISERISALAPDAAVVHHQRLLQAPSLLRTLDVPSVYMVQEPRRRSFEYDLRHPEDTPRLPRRLLNAPVDALEWWARRHDISATRAATALLCNSDHSREFIWRAYGRDATVVRLGVDADRFVLPDEDDRDDEVLAVGSLDPTKGHDLAIEAVAAVDPAIRPALRIISNRAAAGAAERLAALASSLDVHLQLDSAVPESELVRRYQRARAVILTARVEPLGLTSLEAFACGTPVVAVREGGYRETVVDGQNGYLTDRSPDALGAGITRVIRAELPTTRQALRDNVLAEFPWEPAARVYADSLRSAIATNRAAS